MTVYHACRHVAHRGARNLFRRYMTYLSGMGLFVVVGACGGRHKTEAVETSEQAPAEQAVQDAAPRAKAKAASLRDRPPGLIYRQATEQARQHLTADNAHLRLDELDQQIEHEKESSR